MVSVRPITQSKYGAPFATVTGFGAIGDGVTDDTAAIQAAMNAVLNVNSATENAVSGGQLVFPYPPGGFYKITAPLVIPVGAGGYSNGWSMVGAGGRVPIQQMTDNKPIFHFKATTASWTGWRIKNFQFQWLNNQPFANQLAFGIMFDADTAGQRCGAWDWEIANIKNVNGCRGAGIKLYFSEAGNADLMPGTIAVWGGVVRRVYQAFGTSGGALSFFNHLDGAPNLRFEHIYCNQSNTAFSTPQNEQMISVAGCSVLNIDNWENNFTDGSLGYFQNCFETHINGVRLEGGNINNSTTSALFTLHQSTGVHIENVTINNSTINASGANIPIVYSDSASTCRINGINGLPTLTFTSGGLVVWDCAADTSYATLQSLSDFQYAGMTLCKSTMTTGRMGFASQRSMEFYLNTLSGTATNTPNQSGSNIIDQIVDKVCWIGGIELFVDAAVTGGSINVKIFKNGSLLDSGNLTVSLTSGTNGSAIAFTQCKNTITASGAYKCVPGDKLHVVFTTASMTGPSNAKANVMLVDLGGS